MSRILPGSRNKLPVSSDSHKPVSKPAAKEPAYVPENNSDVLAPRNKVATPQSSQGIAWGGPTMPASQDGFATARASGESQKSTSGSGPSMQAPSRLQRSKLPPPPGPSDPDPVDLRRAAGEPPPGPVGEVRTVLQPIEPNRTFKSGDVFDNLVRTGAGAEPGSVLQPIEPNRTFKSGDVFDNRAASTGAAAPTRGAESSGHTISWNSPGTAAPSDPTSGNPKAAFEGYRPNPSAEGSTKAALDGIP